MPDILTLPNQPLAPSRINPKISMFYGVPKIGKTTATAMLPKSMLLDFERGAELIKALRVPISSISGGTLMNDDGTIKVTSLDSVLASIEDIGKKEFAATGKIPKPPYKFLIVDTVDKLEEYAEITATEKYKNSVLGKKFDGNTVLELPQGGGYYHLRQEVLLQIERIARVCEYLILISHVKDKLLDKGGVQVSINELSLTGKLGSIVAAKADVIGYLYREPGKEGLQVSFETYESSVMGARVPRLAGKRMRLDWKEVFEGEFEDAIVVP